MKSMIVFYVLLIFAGVAAISVVFYAEISNEISATTEQAVLYPNNISKLNWRTYTNHDYGFRMQIPRIWTVNAQKDGRLCFISPSTKTTMKTLNYKGPCGDIVFTNKTLEETAILGTVTTKIINGLTFSYYLSGSGIESANFEIENNQRIYDFYGQTDQTESMLSTFKIIN
jgi:hypothetical protein